MPARPVSRPTRRGVAASSNRDRSGGHDVFPPGASSPEGIDLTLVDAWLEMTPEQRLDALQEMLDFVALARRGRPAEAP
ncbi:MAG TPA: hypothetical protein VLF66_19900 [Thermoanaerobaculia bacterium]|nr:hypothetical protein [Thermoanaerobaculia bacterium]